MLKQTITYEDFDGEQCEETLYFNLTQTEIVQWQASLDGNLVKHFSEVMTTGNHGLIMEAFKDLLKRTYGVRSADGKRFIKTKALAEEFEQTAAYDAFFMQLVSGGAEAAANFINGIMPRGMTTSVPTAPELLTKMQEMIDAGDVEGATALAEENIQKEKDVREVVLHNEKPVTDKNVPRLELPPVETTPRSLDEMSREELIEHFSKHGQPQS